MTPSLELLKIGEVSAQTQIPIKTIRYYEERGLLCSQKRTSGGFRLFDHAVLGRLQFIKRSQALGLSLQDIQDILSIADQGERPCHNVRQKFQQRIAEVEERITQLEQLRAQMVALMQNAQASEQMDADICPIIEHAPSPPIGYRA